MKEKKKNKSNWLIPSFIAVVIILLLSLKWCGHPFGKQSPAETQLTAETDSLRDKTPPAVIQIPVDTVDAWENQYETLIAQANKYRENKDYESAKEMYQQAQQLAQTNGNEQKTDEAAKGNHAFSSFLQGEAYFKKEDFANAKTSFSKAKDTGFFPYADIEQLIQRCEDEIIREQARQQSILINGVRWATCNVATPGTFAANPEEAGMFYQWNNKKAWASTSNVTNWDRGASTGATWEKENDPSPNGWRTPAFDEIKTLLDKDKVNSEWTTVKGVKGRKFTDKANGNSIFLPAVGGRLHYSKHSDVGISGFYWAGTTNKAGEYSLSFDSKDAGSGHSPNKVFGFSIRSVAK
jgi:hypothetical protein